MMHIVLVQPEIPQNTGNIARTCAATGARLHLIEPLGFELSDKYLKRAGLDYWKLMQYEIHPSWEAFREKYPDARMHFATTKAPRDYCAAEYRDGDFLVFGRETRGLDEQLLSDQLRAVHSHSDASGRAEPEPFQFRGDRIVRIASAAGFSESEGRRQSDPDRSAGRLARLCLRKRTWKIRENGSTNSLRIRATAPAAKRID